MAEQSKDDVLSVITQIVSEESGVAAKDITRETAFATDIDVDALGLLSIATKVSESFRVALDAALIPTLPTVGALVDLVTSKKA